MQPPTTVPPDEPTQDREASLANDGRRTRVASRARRRDVKLVWEPFEPPLTADERLETIALGGVRGLGAVGIARLFRREVRIIGGVVSPAEQPPLVPRARPGEVLRARVPDPAAREGVRARAQRMLDGCVARGIRALSFVDADYPPMLFDLEDSPPILYALGDPALAALPTVALVGSRDASAYGRSVARDLAARLAEHGICVVSGLARGIDGESHAAALEHGGATIAVLGTGVDVPYPREHAELHGRIAREGLVLSELPPGRRAHPGAFPSRNRIIAALADVVVVVEAGVRSGALITAELADAMDRTVAAVPGRVDDELSRGANQLVRDSKHPITSFDDLLALVALSRRAVANVTKIRRVPSAATRAMASRPIAGPTDPGAPEGREGTVGRAVDARVELLGLDERSPEWHVLEVLAYGPQGTDDLVRVCGMAPRAIAMALSTLAMRGAVIFDAAGMVQRVAQPGQRLAVTTGGR